MAREKMVSITLLFHNQIHIIWQAHLVHLNFTIFVVKERCSTSSKAKRKSTEYPFDKECTYSYISRTNIYIFDTFSAFTLFVLAHSVAKYLAFVEIDFNIFY